MNDTAASDPSRGDGGARPPTSRERLRSLLRLLPWRLAAWLLEQQRRLAELDRQVTEASRRTAEQVAASSAAATRRSEALEEAVRTLQRDAEALRDERLAALEQRLTELAGQIARVRDEMVPAASARFDVLVDRLATELEELASLVERQLLGEPLPAPFDDEAECTIAAELATVQPQLMELFRGGEDEISHRLDRYLPELRAAAPVLDLGSGRGELLVLLREAGVQAKGVEGDPALSAAARRRGLDIDEGDVLDVISGHADARWGAVTAFHLFEHLPPTRLLQLLAQVRRVLRPGGLLLAECPNPHTLRVGASEFWRDPTHLRPLPPETLTLLVQVSGFQVAPHELLRPYPEEQRFATASTDVEEEGGREGALRDRLRRLEQRLDQVVNGPRDYVIRARTPTQESSGRRPDRSDGGGAGAVG